MPMPGWIAQRTIVSSAIFALLLQRRACYAGVCGQRSARRVALSNEDGKRRSLGWRVLQRLAVPLSTGNLGQRLALLLPASDALLCVAERDDGQDVKLLRDAQNGLDRRQCTGETNPVRGYPFLPCRQHHRLNSAAAVGDGPTVGRIDDDSYRERGFR